MVQNVFLFPSETAMIETPKFHWTFTPRQLDEESIIDKINLSLKHINLSDIWLMRLHHHHQLNRKIFDSKLWLFLLTSNTNTSFVQLASGTKTSFMAQTITAIHNTYILRSKNNTTAIMGEGGKFLLWELERNTFLLAELARSEGLSGIWFMVSHSSCLTQDCGSWGGGGRGGGGAGGRESITDGQCPLSDKSLRHQCNFLLLFSYYKSLDKRYECHLSSIKKIKR